MIFIALEKYITTHTILIPPSRKGKEGMCDLENIACLL